MLSKTEKFMIIVHRHQLLAKLLLTRLDDPVLDIHLPQHTDNSSHGDMNLIQPSGTVVHRPLFTTDLSAPIFLHRFVPASSPHNSCMLLPYWKMQERVLPLSGFTDSVVDV